MSEFILKLFKKDKNDREAVGKLAGFLGIAGNIVLCIIKLVAGIAVNSVSVIADAVNSLSDAMSSVITIVCFKLSGKPADKDHPYGHERIEYVITIVLAFVIIFIGYELVRSSFDRIINPVYIPLRGFTVVILVISIATKITMGKMYSGFSGLIKSAVLKASARDSYNDAVSTGAVLVSAVIGGIFTISLDGYVGLVVSLFIIWSGVCLVRENMDTLMGKPPEKEFVDEIQTRVMAYDAVIGIHDLIVHSYGPSKTFVSVHAEVDAKVDMLQSHDIIDNIEREVSSAMGISLVIHMDPIVTDDPEVVLASRKVYDIILDIDSSLSMHDFRTVPGKTHTNLIFDVVIPFEFRYKEQELSEMIQKEVTHRLGGQYFCVVNFDRSYS